MICLCFRTITSMGQDPFVIITRSNFEIQKLPKFGIRVSRMSRPRFLSRFSATSDPTPRSKSRSSATSDPTPRSFVIIARSNFKIQKLPKFGIRVSEISTPRSKSTCSAISDPTPRSKSRSTATPRFFYYYYTLQLQDSKVALIWYPRKSNINAKIQK